MYRTECPRMGYLYYNTVLQNITKTKVQSLIIFNLRYYKRALRQFHVHPIWRIIPNLVTFVTMYQNSLLYLCTLSGVLDESEIPADFLAEIKSDLSHTLQALGKEATSETRKFHRICCDPLVYVHVYHKDELTANSSVSVLAWDALSTITNENRLLQSPPLPVRSVDFRPFLYDNHGLKKMGVTSDGVPRCL